MHYSLFIIGFGEVTKHNYNFNFIYSPCTKSKNTILYMSVLLTGSKADNSSKSSFSCNQSQRTIRDTLHIISGGIAPPPRCQLQTPRKKSDPPEKKSNAPRLRGYFHEKEVLKVPQSINSTDFIF